MLMPNSSANASNGTAAPPDGPGPGFNFAGVVLDRLCPGNDAADIRAASDAHLSPFQLLLTACLVVAALTLVPAALQKAELCLLDLNGDGKVDAKDVEILTQRCRRFCPCCRCLLCQRRPQTPVPTLVSSYACS